MGITRRAFIRGVAACTMGAVCGTLALNNPAHSPTLEILEKNEKRPKTSSVDLNPSGIVRSGFAQLDWVLGCIPDRSLTLITSRRPGLGVTELALNMAVNAARLDASVLYFSLADPGNSLFNRIRAIEKRHAAESSFSVVVYEEHTCRKPKMTPGKLLINDTPALSISDIRSESFRAFRGSRSECGLIIVDYIELVEPRLNRAEDVHLREGGVYKNEAYALQDLTRELDIPIVVCTQALKARWTRPECEYSVLRVLRNRGLEHAPDVSLVLGNSENDFGARNRERFYDGSTEIYVAKNRYGEAKLTIPLS